MISVKVGKDFALYGNGAVIRTDIGLKGERGSTPLRL